ncbi:PocR ligand-binding domain-containing protein [Syntrophotalea acetylenica]|uniref:PocR ligand-binding domain-containing protein n=1 Tax=Syntrophotalea acetylenica TaxID=29542 RepID=UPI002A361832|nr:PocR ligand-binding domain-containing protein [Syntrophotalea acetylenica]MDY0261630.1 PocR ligand-binding domain-containing protein [Syntrophotalea acetylenica]
MLYRFEEIFDISQIRELAQRFSDLVGITAAIIGVDGTIWAKCNWQEICENFHRKHPVTHQRCIESDICLPPKYFKDSLTDTIIYRCQNGLMEAAAPIRIQGEHIANLYMGQFLLQPPDIAFFMQQARDFGFDETAYIQALLKVPVFSEDKVKSVTDYFSKLAIVIGEMGLSQVRLNQANEHLKKSEQRYRLVVENSASAIMVVQNDTIVFANRKIIDGFGSNQNIFQFIHPEDQASFRAFLDQTRQGASDAPLEGTRIVNDPQKTRWVQTNAVAMDWQGSQALLLHMTDITSQKEAEKAMRKAQLELANSQKMEAIANLATGVAHDFNNFAQIIGTNVELLLAAEDKTSPIYGKLKEIELAVIKTSELTQRLLMFREDQPGCRQSVDINQLIDQVAHSLRALLPSSIDFDLSLQADCKVKDGDPVQLFQIFMNLLLNAKDAMPDGGTIHIETRNFIATPSYAANRPNLRPGEYIQVRVLDEGPGLSDQDLIHLFEPFYTSKQPGQGTGLGLTTVYNFVKNHSGHITCGNNAEKGACISIMLPATRVDHQIIRFPIGGHETILLVDDDPYILHRGREYLHSYGYTVLEAQSGEEAYEIYCQRRDDIRLVIMDLIMPGMGGEKCIGELLGIDPEAKILVASAYLTENFIHNRDIRDKIKGFVAKPYIKGRLLQAIRKAITSDQKQLCL